MVLAVLGGCDTTTPNATEDDPRSDDTKIQISEIPFDRADLKYDPVSLAPGETFSISLSDARRDRPVTRILHEGLPGGGNALRASFAPLQPSSVTIRCRNTIAGTAQTMAKLDGDELGPGSGPQPVAKSDSEPEPTSYHYYEDGAGTVVEVDYDQQVASDDPDAGSSFDFSGSAEPARCTHVSFVLHGVDTSLAPTGVEFGGDASAPTLRRQKVQVSGE
jgi:hypothetical protein